MSDTKTCSCCGEEVKAAAKKCKHCHSMLEETTKQSFASKTQERKPTKPKKPIWKRWWVWAIVIILFIGFINSGGDNNDEAVPETQTEEAATTEMPQEAEPEPEPEPDTDIVSEEVLIESMLGILKNSFEGSATVHVDETNKMFIITPTDPDLIESFTYVTAGHEEITRIYRDNVESQRKLSETIAETLPEYSLAIANPYDPDLLYLVIWNGIVIYDFTDDL